MLFHAFDGEVVSAVLVAIGHAWPWLWRANTYISLRNFWWPHTRSVTDISSTRLWRRKCALRRRWPWGWPTVDMFSGPGSRESEVWIRKRCRKWFRFDLFLLQFCACLLSSAQWGQFLKWQTNLSLCSVSYQWWRQVVFCSSLRLVFIHLFFCCFITCFFYYLRLIWMAIELCTRVQMWAEYT